jgi:hypothetical protein
MVLFCIQFFYILHWDSLDAIMSFSLHRNFQSNYSWKECHVHFLCLIFFASHLGYSYKLQVIDVLNP